MEENWRLANQAEQMRLVVATGNLLLATVLQMGVAFLGLSQRALLLTGWMILLGVYGVFAGRKLYEREAYHRLRVRKLRARLNDLYPDAELEKIFKDVEQEHKQIYPRLMYIRLNAIWIMLYAMTALLGVVESVLCLLR